MENTLNIAGIGQISMTVQDLARAIPWYRDVLGLRFLFQAESMGFFDCEGIRLMLAEPEDVTSRQGSSILYFRVEDIAGQVRILREKGARIVRDPQLTAEMPDHDLWMAFFEDSEGNLLALMEEKPKPGGG